MMSVQGPLGHSTFQKSTVCASRLVSANCLALQRRRDPGSSAVGLPHLPFQKRERKSMGTASCGRGSKASNQNA